MDTYFQATNQKNDSDAGMQCWFYWST